MSNLLNIVKLLTVYTIGHTINHCEELKTLVN